MEKRDASYTVDGNVNWHSYYGEQYGGSLCNKNRAKYDPVLSLLSIDLKKIKTLIQKDTHTPMLIAPLFTIARIWKQTGCLLTVKWIKKNVVHICNGILLSPQKMNLSQF